MSKQLTVNLNENNGLALSDELMEITEWGVGEKVLADYNEQKDTLILKPVSEVYEIRENNTLVFSKEIIQEASLFGNIEFEWTFDEVTDELRLKPISKTCPICEEQNGKIKIHKSYICDSCQSKLLSLSEAH